ncbi:dihydrofolate reductase [Spiroplasma endosymbiont of Aspidapion aeneum]|uniref:dihydrofolate reductase n=1 Tax=Spiroplasma endosymbiont of Aspidapion aeneum TaxID=3066276 RepID=UPI00313AD9B6
MITLIWAMTENNVIGYQNRVPWYIKEDLLHFKNYTLNKTVVMGRVTFESLNCVPLKNRKNIVVSHNVDLKDKYRDVVFINDFYTFLKDNNDSEEEIVVIGGAQIYEIALPYASRLVISIIKHKNYGDVYFPKFSLDKFYLSEKKSYSEFNVLYYNREKKLDEK